MKRREFLTGLSFASIVWVADPVFRVLGHGTDAEVFRRLLSAADLTPAGFDRKTQTWVRLLLGRQLQWKLRPGAVPKNAIEAEGLFGVYVQISYPNGATRAEKAMKVEQAMLSLREYYRDVLTRWEPV